MWALIAPNACTLTLDNKNKNFHILSEKKNFALPQIQYTYICIHRYIHTYTHTYIRIEKRLHIHNIHAIPSSFKFQWDVLVVSVIYWIIWQIAYQWLYEGEHTSWRKCLWSIAGCKLTKTKLKHYIKFNFITIHHFLNWRPNNADMHDHWISKFCLSALSYEEV